MAGWSFERRQREQQWRALERWIFWSQERLQRELSVTDKCGRVCVWFPGDDCRRSHMMIVHIHTHIVKHSYTFTLILSDMYTHMMFVYTTYETWGSKVLESSSRSTSICCLYTTFILTYTYGTHLHMMMMMIYIYTYKTRGSKVL